ncbi:MAG: zinc finger domain-containing protein [Planctomycetaceae bacterium]
MIPRFEQAQRATLYCPRCQRKRVPRPLWSGRGT